MDSDIPVTVAKILLKNGWNELDAAAVMFAMQYAAYITDERIKACVGAATMFRWQTWKFYKEE